MNKVKESLTVMDAINARRSVRTYAQHRLNRTTIHTLLAAAVRAPTARHEEPWLFVIIQDASIMRRVSDHAKGLIAEDVARVHHDRGGHAVDVFTQPEFNIFYGADTLIVICTKLMSSFAVADCWLAAENLLLTATAMGLGSCVIGSAVTALNNPALKTELGIPTDVTAIAPIIVGVPSGETWPTARKEPLIIAWK